MDSSSWIHGYAANINDSGGRGGISGFMCDCTASCIPAVFQCRKQEQQENELLVSSQIQQHLNQISMQLNIDDESAAAYSSQHGSSVVDDFDFLPNSCHATGGCSFPSSSSTSSSFSSALLPCSPETSSTVAQFLATGLQFPEVSSLVPPDTAGPYIFRALGRDKQKKKDRASVLIIAREYVNSLKSKVCELEEKNQALQSQLARRATSAQEDDVGEKVEIQTSKAATAEDDQTGEVFMVQIVTRPVGGNTTDMVLRTLQCLKDEMGEDVSLVSMSTADDSDGPHRASLSLHLKSASGTNWEEAVREAIRKAVTSQPPAGLGWCWVMELAAHARDQLVVS